MIKKINFKLTSVFIAALFMFSLVIPFSFTSVFAYMPKEADVFYFNDFHGAVENGGGNAGIVKFAGEIKKLTADNPNSIVLSGGDMFQGSAPSNLTHGAIVNEMLKEIGLTASSVGNHEFDWGVDVIPTWASEGGYEFLASNIYDKTTGQPVTWAKPYMIEEVGGIKIGIIGLATPETAYKTAAENVANIEFKNPSESAKEWAVKLKDGSLEETVDVVIALTHLGAFQDKDGNITGEAAELAEIDGLSVDAILAAHTHQKVVGEVNEIPILESYYNGRIIGQLHIAENEGGTFSITATNNYLYEYDANGSKVSIEGLVDDANTQAIYDDYMEKLSGTLNEILGTTDKELSHDKTTGLSILGEWTTKVMAEETDSQIGITNGGGLRRSLLKGDITMGDMYEVMPFDNTLVTMKLKGSDLKRVLENGILNDSIGWVQFYGVKVYYDKTAEAGERITAMVLSDGTKVDMDKKYTVVTNDFMFGGGDNYDFTGAEDVVNTYIPIRDNLADKVREVKNVSFEYEELLIDGELPEEVEATEAEDLPETGSSVDMNVLGGAGLIIVILGLTYVVIEKKKKTA
ncbi:MAG: 5'-nucleotidase C-terminal domain-containing protein [Clostridiaceae bacterium]